MNFKRTTRSAFTLVEAVVAMAVCGIMIVALYSGITSGFFHIRMARENFRATQIMVEKMEVIRLLTWDQINSNGFVPPTFSAPYYPDNSTSATNSASGGLVYNGTITITDVPNSWTYNDDLRLVTVTLNWTTKDLPRTRQLSTYVSRYGIQNYLFN